MCGGCSRTVFSTSDRENPAHAEPERRQFARINQTPDGREPQESRMKRYSGGWNYLSRNARIPGGRRKRGREDKTVGNTPRNSPACAKSTAPAPFGELISLGVPNTKGGKSRFPIPTLKRPAGRPLGFRRIFPTEENAPAKTQGPKGKGRKNGPKPSQNKKWKENSGSGNRSELGRGREVEKMPSFLPK